MQLFLHNTKCYKCVFYLLIAFYSILFLVLYFIFIGNIYFDQSYFLSVFMSLTALGLCLLLPSLH